MYCIYEDNVFTNLWIGLPIRLRPGHPAQESGVAIELKYVNTHEVSA